MHEGKADVKLDNCSFGILGELHAHYAMWQIELCDFVTY